MRTEHYKSRVASYGMGHTRRDRMLSLIHGAGNRILDIGCASGAFGARLKELGNTVEGVELSEAAVVDAKRRLDAVWSFDIEDEWPQQIPEHSFDYVVLGEVLEHVFDPVNVLRCVRAVLKSDGAVIISTPNFLTWTNRLRFVFGAFRYTTEGMFDFGHIRWFTYAYLREVLTEAGFRITDERHILFPGKLAWLVRRWPSLFAWQFIVRAVPMQ